MTVIALGAVSLFGIWFLTGMGCNGTSDNGLTGPDGSLCFDKCSIGLCGKDGGGDEPPEEDVEDEEPPEEEEEPAKLPLVSRFPGKNEYASNLARAYASSLQNNITIA